MAKLPGSKRKSALVAFLCLLLPAFTALAETIEAKLPSGIKISADYRSGLPSQAAVLLVHGFMQTHHAEPINALAGNLASKGHTTLSPTFSLNMNHRKQSMPCGAVHTHTLEEDTAEMTYWINWLNKQGHKNIIIVAFSTGSIQALLFDKRVAYPSIRKIVLISLTPMFIEPAEYQKNLAQINTTGNDRDKTPQLFSMGYCKKNYAATRKSYLSYAKYDEKHLLELLNQTSLPYEIILGADDFILPGNWVDRIKSLKTPGEIRVIKNANHFFEDAQEFDLAEAVEQAIKNVVAK